MTPPPRTPNPAPKADSGAATLLPEDAELFQKCLVMIKQEERISASLIQRRFILGYTRAKRLLLALEQAGYIAPQESESGTAYRVIIQPIATPPQSEPALAAAEAIEYHNPDNLPSPGEAPWRFLVKGEEKPWDVECWYPYGKNPRWLKASDEPHIGTKTTYRTREPLPRPLAPSPALGLIEHGGAVIHRLTHSEPVGWPDREMMEQAWAEEDASALLPAPAPEGRGETAETPETNEAWIAAKEKYLATYSPASKASHWFKVAEETREHAKRLERERNHLRKKVAQYRADFENANYRNEEMRRERDAAVAQAQALREAGSALVERMKLVHDHPLYQSVWLCALNHGVSYATGPTYEMELKALAAALAASEAGK